MDEFDNDLNEPDLYGGASDDFDMDMDDEMEGMHLTSEDDEEDPEDRFH